ncbi:MAG: electron transport complex subunit RsxE [Bacilli bacterium]|jgi:electron transport complex protein RnfE|nr:electron transport complex subunit RsxE [Bacilli bacterium]
MENKSVLKDLKDTLTLGMFKQNPTFILFLGMCPALGITTKCVNAIGMGAAVIFVMFFSNIIVSLIRHIVMDEIRIPVFIIIIAALVTILEMGMEMLTPELYDAMKVFIPLIVANCIPLARCEAFAQFNNPFKSALDAIGMGIGFTIGLLCLSFVRELLGLGTVFGVRIIPTAFTIPAFSSSCGAFLTLAICASIAAALVIRNRKRAQLKEEVV